MMRDGHRYYSIINYNTIKPRRNKRECVDDNDAARTARRSWYNIILLQIHNAVYKYLSTNYYNNNIPNNIII